MYTIEDTTIHDHDKTITETVKTLYSKNEAGEYIEDSKEERQFTVNGLIGEIIQLDEQITHLTEQRDEKQARVDFYKAEFEKLK